MNNHHLLILFIVTALLISMPAVPVHANDATNRHNDEGLSEHANGEGSVQISSDMQRRVGIRSELAGPGTIERHIQVYGRLLTPPTQHANIAARFPGVITAIKVNVGDRVGKGDTLIVVESNQSLKNYALKAPFAGVVQALNASVGEMTSGTAVVSVSDNSRLWAELKVFPSQRFEVQVGQPVHIQHNRDRHEGVIGSVTPASHQQAYVLARVALDNPDGEMTPGELISAEIDAELVSVPLRINALAVQTVEEQTVVFVQRGDHFEARPVVLGRSDGSYSEVLEGLTEGERYVSENSYLIKADLLKAGSQHSH